METKELIVFEEIIAPLIPLIEGEADKLLHDEMVIAAYLGG